MLSNLFIQEEFCEPVLCKSIISTGREIDNSSVSTRTGNRIVKSDFRKSFQISFDKHFEQLIRNKLESLIPELIEKYDFTLSNLSELQVLKYSKSHFFKPHKDNISSGPSSERLLTALIFLNTSAKYEESKNSFFGGELVIYGLHKNHPSKGLPVYAKEGRLVIFSSHLVHEVKPISSGTRYCLVGWYNGPKN